MKVVATVEARMTSSRLPGKVLMPAGGKPMLRILLERLGRVSAIDEIVVATTTNAADDPIVDLARETGVGVFRGSEHDVLGRVAGALAAAGAEIAVEITADCPLIDPELTQACIDAYVANRDCTTYVANTTGPVLGVPPGLDVQVFSAAALAEIAETPHDAEAREHVSIPFYRPENRDRYRPIFLFFFPLETCRSVWVSLDYPEDYALIRACYETLAPGDAYFDASRIVEFCLERGDLTVPCLKRRGLAP